MIRYALIDSDGELHVKDGSYQEARAEVGPEGWDRVRLLPPPGHARDWAGWINDDGHRLGLPRNIIGGLVLNGLGATVLPYPGPVVITGWEYPGQPTEVTSLCVHQERAIREIHAEARRALDGAAAGGWADDARAIAEWMRTAPVPTLIVRRVEDVLGFLRGQS